jgi:CheY-like chemotaxis protein
MLAFARRQELKLETTNLHTLVQGLIGMFERTLGPSFVLACDVSRDLPPVTSDINQLETGLLNLVVNARDAMANGGTISIGARCEKIVPGTSGHQPAAPGEYVVLMVVDQGAGMDEATIARAMEPFFTTKGVGKGTGLGLSMVHGMAEQLGGRLVLKSKVGGGTIAEIWLPVARSDIADAAIQNPAAVQPQGTLSSKVILVIDDDALVRVNTSAMLEELGHTVIEAASAKEAFAELAAGAHVDMVVTDHAMPGTTGAELAATLGLERPEMPVLLVTGYAELPENVDPTLPKLSKPFTLGQLAEALANNGKRARAGSESSLP